MVSVTIKICSLSPKLIIRVSFHISSNSFHPSTQPFQTISYKVQPLLRFLLSPFLLVVMVPHTTRPHSLPHCSQIPLDYPSGLVPMLFNERTIKGAGELYHRPEVISHCSLTIQVCTLTCSSYSMAFFPCFHAFTHAAHPYFILHLITEPLPTASSKFTFLWF